MMDYTKLYSQLTFATRDALLFGDSYVQSYDPALTQHIN